MEYECGLESFKSFEFSGSFTFWRYRSFLPNVENVVSLGEGGTHLHRAKRTARAIGLGELYLKDETRNPTGSFRDRCATLLISNAVDLNYRTVVCATNGNLGASIAAYCAKGGLACHVVVPRNVDVGKLAQLLVYGAIVEECGEIVDDSLVRAEELAKETGWYQGSVELNPLSLEALKTIAYEVFEQLGVPDWFIVPLGSGGTLYAIWKGFMELEKIGKVNSSPRMVGVQADGCAPIVNAYLQNLISPVPVERPSTHALAILVKNPSYGKCAVEVIRKTKGIAVSVSDEEIFSAERELAKFEGIFSEPASAATYAALKRLMNQGIVDKADKVVCLITGSGLKATDILQALTKRRKDAAVGLELSTKEKILRILSEGDTYGYNLWKRLGMIMTRAAVYQHLRELSERGLIAEYARGRRRFFKITSRGKRVLDSIDDLKLLL
ncbi:MAG: threonine synthase [Candidatus Bathyarchaeota archaeon]|nr:threonine synthase [Candidatus Bathyarchaeota archaeon]MCX8176882.1 threonine synthase [Candidatus Bathyarchaeota archaeon]MDW8193433.1 threonine synthase [Nitrososphaerota archaeon]